MVIFVVILSSLLIRSSSSTPLSKGVCGDFAEGACELSEDNILDHDRFTNTAGECQALCKANGLCKWFTHFDTQCYLLAECGTTEHCTGCVSGPTTPEFGSCPWPPGPTVSPTVPTTSTTTTKKTTSTTTQTTTKKTTSTTTTKKSTTTTTKKSTTTTTEDSHAGCEEIHINSQCDWDYGLITWYEQVMTGSECQYICKNVGGAKFFSHYNEGHHAEHGFCGCFSTCAWPTTHDCHDRCDTHETFSIESFEEEDVIKEDLDSSETFGVEVGVEIEAERWSDGKSAGHRRCHCLRGPLDPDVDSCDLWP